MVNKYTQARRVRERLKLSGQIVEVAKILAAKEGWSAVTIRRIAAMIEYSPPTIYEYFENKDALILAVRSEAFTQFNNALKNARLQGRNHPDQFRRMALAYWKFANDNPELYQAMFGIGVSHDVSVRIPHAAEAFNELYTVVHSFEPDALAGETRERALVVWSALHGVVALSSTGHLQKKEGNGQALVSRVINDFIQSYGDK